VVKASDCGSWEASTEDLKALCFWKLDNGAE